MALASQERRRKQSFAPVVNSTNMKNLQPDVSTHSTLNRSQNLSHKIENLALDLILKVGDCPDDIAEVLGWAEGAIHEAVTI